MADKRVLIARSKVFGPAGNTTPADKRVLIARSILTGPKDKRVLIARSVLDAPTRDKRVFIANSNLHGPSAPARPIYIKTSSGWQPVDVYVAVAGTWIKVTPP